MGVRLQQQAHHRLWLDLPRALFTERLTLWVLRSSALPPES